MRDVVYIERDFQFLLSLAPATRPISLLHGPFASFDPYALVLNAPLPEYAITGAPDDAIIRYDLIADRISSRFATASSTDERYLIANQETAWIHELQHFKDCVFTPAGARHFLYEANQLHRIFCLLVDIRKHAQLIRRPIASIIEHPPVNAAERDRLVELYAQIFDLHMQRCMFNGDIESQVIEDSTYLSESVALIFHVPMPNGDHLLPYFPKTAAIDGVMGHILDPIGFRQLTEARALHAQHEIVSMVDASLIGFGNLLLRNEPDYSTANMLFTKKYKLAGAAEHASIHGFTMDFTRWLFHSLHGGGAHGSVSYPGLSAISLAADHVGAKGFDHPAYASDELEANLAVDGYIDELLQHFANDDNFIAQFIKLVSTNLLKPGLAYYRQHDDRPIGRDHPMDGHFRSLMDDGTTSAKPSLPGPFAYFDGEVTALNHALIDGYTKDFRAFSGAGLRFANFSQKLSTAKILPAPWRMGATPRC